MPEAALDEVSGLRRTACSNLTTAKGRQLKGLTVTSKRPAFPQGNQVSTVVRREGRVDDPEHRTVGMHEAD